jgi:hypothetical protein
MPTLHLLIRETEWILNVRYDAGPSKVGDVDTNTSPKTLINRVELLVKVTTSNPKLNLRTEIQ